MLRERKQGNSLQEHSSTLRDNLHQVKGRPVHDPMSIRWMWWRWVGLCQRDDSEAIMSCDAGLLWTVTFTPDSRLIICRFIV